MTVAIGILPRKERGAILLTDGMNIGQIKGEQRVWQGDDKLLGLADPAGEYIPRSRLYADYRVVLNAAGLGHLRFHDLRHSTGSILFAQGVPMKVIQMVLRHGQIGTTMNTYVHLRSEGLSEARAAMERALG